MPYKSKAQMHFFEGCRANPDKMSGKCPPKKVLSEFHKEAKMRRMPKGSGTFTVKEVAHLGYRRLG